MPALAAIPNGGENDLPCSGSVIVERGDTLQAIAGQCGVDVAAILSANGTLANPDRLTVGQELVIPGAVAVADLTAEALEEILAPVALYPDALLAEVLPAATYPLEVVEAHRWVQNGHDADDLDNSEWAPSVQALVRYPEVLGVMSNDLEWTISLGDAFLAQPDDVFDTIQVLRARAKEVGNLESNEHQVVVTEPAETVEVVEPVVEQRHRHSDRSGAHGIHLRAVVRSLLGLPGRIRTAIPTTMGRCFTTARGTSSAVGCRITSTGITTTCAFTRITIATRAITRTRGFTSI